MVSDCSQGHNYLTLQSMLVFDFVLLPLTVFAF
jgi:hypothetical protein